MKPHVLLIEPMVPEIGVQLAARPDLRTLFIDDDLDMRRAGCSTSHLEEAPSSAARCRACWAAAACCRAPASAVARCV
jgi:hypothetical protein